LGSRYRSRLKGRKGLGDWRDGRWWGKEMEENCKQGKMCLEEFGNERCRILGKRK
jgi:hypothetical protein